MGALGTSPPSEPSAAGAGPRGRDRVRLVLEVVLERRERRCFGLSGGVGERLGEQSVGEPWVAGQQRPMQVRAVDATVAATLVA